MAEVRETHVIRDAQGRVTDSQVRVYEDHDDRGPRASDQRPRKRKGFGRGLLLGIILVVALLALYAWSQGSFTQAGAQADRAAATVEQSADAAIERTENTISETQANE